MVTTTDHDPEKAQPCRGGPTGSPTGWYTGAAIAIFIAGNVPQPQRFSGFHRGFSGFLLWFPIDGPCKSDGLPMMMAGSFCED